jgi:hypothetical protein
VEIAVFLIGQAYKVFFSRADEQISRRLGRELESDIREAFSQIILDREGSVTIEARPKILAFDFSIVIVATRYLRFRIIRGRGDLDVYVAASKSPQEWHTLGDVLCVLNETELREHSPMKEVANVVCSNFDKIVDLFSSDENPLRIQLAEIEMYKRRALKQWEYEINRSQR